jgi:hypothetical protein
VTALYRKYRPQDFDEVVGQDAVVRTLKNAIASGQVRQAYLFAGPRGTGKTSMARILAKALNCAQGPTPAPDNTCNACVTIAAGTSLDVVEMDAASQRGIDDIREIRERAVLQPVEGRYKVYILDEAHQLTPPAWNALLKIIEEPPPHLLFVFCTTELSKVLETVRSRCQTFVFSRPRLPDLVKLLRTVAGGDMRQGGDPRLPLELALVKVTRPGADLSAESISYRLEQLEQRGPSGHVHVSDTTPRPEEPRPETTPSPEPPSLELEQLREVWQRSVIPAVQTRAIHAAPVIGEATPAALDGDRLTLEFPPSADFHRKLAEEKYQSLLRDALYEVTGRKLELEFALGENSEEPDEEEPPGEENFVALVKETFDAREVEE